MTQNDHHQPTPTKTNKNRLLTFNQTFQSSILDKPQRFMLDKTLVQGIKQNDSSKIVQNGEQADIGQSADLYDQERQIAEVFVSTRKKYDHSKQMAVKVEQRIQKLKKQKEIYQAEKEKIQANFTQEEKASKNIQAERDRLLQLCAAADYDRDIRLQMSQVLRQDILFYKKHCFQANSKIVRNVNKIKSLNGQFESSKKVSSNCRSLIYSIQKKITQKHTERYQKLNSFHQIINKKEQNIIKKQQRQRMIQQSMMQALNGKMPQQRQQRKLLLVNLALKRMLKMKMQRQMQRYNEIQTTFRKIKQNTTVKKADQFIQKFIKRQKNYGQLLQSISKNQQRINQLKQQRQKLQRQLHDNMYEKQAIQDRQNEKKNHANKQALAKIDILREKLLVNQNLKNKTFSFVTKFVAAFDEKNIDDVKEKVSRQKVNQSLKLTLEKINKFLDKMNDQDSEKKLKQIYIEATNLTLPTQVKQKNMRIKTLSTRDQNQNSVMQDHDIAYDDLSEREYLNQNRKQVKKSTYLRNRMKTRAY